MIKTGAARGLCVKPWGLRTDGEVKIRANRGFLTQSFHSSPTVLHKQRLITQNSQISDIFILFVRHKSHRTHIATILFMEIRWALSSRI